MRFRKRNRAPEPPLAPTVTPPPAVAAAPEMEPDERRSWETALSRAGRPPLKMVAGDTADRPLEHDLPRADLRVVPQHEDLAGR